MNSQIIQLLENSHIKPTPMRMLVLEQLIQQQRNLSLTDIEALLYPSDRVTIYRTLQTFVKHGLAHAIETAGNGSIYALCNDDCEKGSHYDHHPHFICEKCRKVTCSSDFIFNLEYMPGSLQYRVDKVEVTLKGICPHCNQ